MSEEKPIPTEMLDAATGVVTDGAAGFYLTGNGCKKVAQAALRAANVPALLKRIAELEAALDLARMQAADNTALTEKAAKYAASKDSRIAELEAALRDRICEGCAVLVANVGMLHLCDCQDQRNLCAACKAGCVCAGGE